MPRTLFRTVWISLIALLLAAPLRADVTRFDLSGVITDGTGGILPGVTITLKNVDTGFNRTAVTDAAGPYSFTALPPTGKWSVTAALARFWPERRARVQLPANTKPQINFPSNVRRS